MYTDDFNLAESHRRRRHRARRNEQADEPQKRLRKLVERELSDEEALEQAHEAGARGPTFQAALEDQDAFIGQPVRINISLPSSM